MSRPTEYRHTQPGTVIRVTLSLTAVLVLTILGLTGRSEPVASLLLAVFLLLLVLLFFLFGSLTVEVTRERIRLAFGVGWVKKSFDLDQVRRANAVRNHWIYGWGVRLTPHGWLYNVSGLDAVEIELENGKKHRIGTDEPKELETVIRSFS